MIYSQAMEGFLLGCDMQDFSEIVEIQHSVKDDWPLPSVIPELYSRYRRR